MIRKHYNAVLANIEPQLYFGVRPDKAHARKVVGMDGKVLGGLVRNLSAERHRKA